LAVGAAVDDGLGDPPEARGLVAVGGGRRRQRLVAVGEVAAGHAGHSRVGRHVARGRRSLHARAVAGRMEEVSLEVETDGDRVRERAHGTQHMEQGINFKGIWWTGRLINHLRDRFQQLGQQQEHQICEHRHLFNSSLHSDFRRNESAS
jgi:hypothetical protein